MTPNASIDPFSRGCAARSRRGAISILAAVTVLALLALIGLALDTALVMTARQQLQRTADAAALAGANEFRVPGQTDWNLVRQAAINTAQNNPVIRSSPIQLRDNPTNDPGNATNRSDIVIGRWQFDRTDHTFKFFPTNFNTGFPVPDSIQVYPRCGDGTLNSSLSLIFSPVFSTLLGTPTDSNVGKPATARLGPPDQPLILVLDPHAPRALLMDGGAHMDVYAGIIQVDSDDGCAFRMNGTSGLMESQRTKVVGGACVDLVNNLQGDLITGAPYVPDPLASLPEPVSPGMTNYGEITAPGTYSPGYYPNGINLNSGIAALLPGVYFIGKGGSARGISLGGSALITGVGVTIYTEPGATITTTGSGSGMVLKPPSSGIYNGVTIFQARTGRSESTIGGGGLFDITGTYYVPNGTLDMHGDVTRRVGKMIVNKLNISGNAQYIVTGEDTPPYVGPLFVFLVK
jgi:Flp pilus assembly protein TadG